MRVSTAARVAAAGIVAFGLVAASVAWACIPQPLLTVEPTATARVGDRVTVRGVHFRGLSEIRLNGVDGRRLATGRGERFMVRLVVPDVRPGLYVLVGITRDPTGGLAASASTPLQIISTRARAGDNSTPGAGAAGPSASPSTGIDPLPAAAGGLVLLVLGALLGGLLVRGRARAA